MSNARLVGVVSSAQGLEGAELAAAWLAARAGRGGYGVHDVLRVADEMGASREHAIVDFLRVVEPSEAHTREASLEDIVLLALSHGVSFERDTLAFLLDLCERLRSPSASPGLSSRPTRVTTELQQLAQLLNAIILGNEADGEALLAAQVWRIEAISAHERDLQRIADSVAQRASIVRRHGLRYFDDADLESVAALMASARDIGETAGTISRSAWAAAVAGVGSIRVVAIEERVFMLDQLATYLLEEAGFAIADDARPLLEAASEGTAMPLVGYGDVAA